VPIAYWYSAMPESASVVCHVAWSFVFEPLYGPSSVTLGASGAVASY